MDGRDLLTASAVAIAAFTRLTSSPDFGELHRFGWREQIELRAAR